MMTGWFILTVTVALFTSLSRPHLFQRGKYLTMPLRKRYPRVFDHVFCRVCQVSILVIVALFVDMFVVSRTVDVITWIIWIALYIDDYYSDNDFKKKLKEVRNKIKWKMDLPAPVKAEKVAS